MIDVPVPSSPDFLSQRTILKQGRKKHDATQHTTTAVYVSTWKISTCHYPDPQSRPVFNWKT